ncbi:MAG: hypothetical protein IJD92_03990 [Bacilli bacterium]|nr:hypothetical protein [Bacilli bacterium]
MEKEYLINKYTLKDLNKSLYLSLDNPSDREISNIKFINPNTVVTITLDNYYKLNNILKEFKENKVILKVKDKKAFDEYTKINKIDYNNLYIKIEFYDEIPYKDYIKYEKLLNDMVMEARSLSPFEKYIYAYNVTKLFKQYKKDEFDTIASRDLYKVLENEYIVCSGFANLFSALLSKLNIDNTVIIKRIDTSYDNIKPGKANFKKQVPINYTLHALVYINLVDEKYNINGYYISSPTDDNVLDKDFYNFLILTDKEYSNLSEYIGLDYLEIFDVNNIEEYYKKTNYLIKKYGFTRYGNYILELLNLLKEIDPLFVTNILKKYEKNDNMEQSIINMIEEIGNYILKKTNKPVDGLTIMKAVKTIYKKFYGYNEETLNKELETTIKYNKKLHKIFFPTRYKLYKDGTKEIYSYYKNKFSFDENEMKLLKSLK